MHNPLLQDLETNFFGISHDNQNKKKYDFKNQQSQEIAQFLLHSQLNYEISELLIQELLEGKRKIRLKDSAEEVSIASNFSIQDLKQKNLLWILDGKIQVPYSYENEDNPELEQTIQNLADIIYSKGKYEPSKLQISKTNASQLSKQTPKFLKNGDQDNFEFDLKYEEIGSVGSELWKLLLSNQTLEQNQKIKKWFALMSNVFDYHDLFCLSFETQEAERLFIEASIEYINAQSILKQSWDEFYLTLLAYNSRFHYCETSSRVPEKLAKLNPQDSIWDAFLWWNSREVEFLANFFSGHYTHWLYFILEKIHQLQNINLFDYIQSLLDKPFITHILFAPFGNFLSPFFLREEKLANIGLMFLGNSIRQKYFPESDYSLHRYETQRCGLFWREGVEFYFSYLDKTMDKQWAGENLAQILLYMSDHFLFNPYLFRFSLDVIATLKNQNKTLVLEEIFDETVSYLIKSYEAKANTQYPSNYFSLLLWLLGQSLHIDRKTIEATISDIINHLISIYNQHYQELNLKIFSEIASDEWKFFLQLATQEQKEAFCKKDIRQIIHTDEAKLFYVSDTARTHLKILLNLFQCDLDESRDDIAQDIIIFCKETMLVDQQKVNLFHPMIWPEDNLAKQLIEKINYFTKVQQKDFIEFLLKHFSLTNLILLAQGLINNKNQEMVLQKLEQYQINSEQDFQTMTEIIKSTNIAINMPRLKFLINPLFDIWEFGENRHFDEMLKECKCRNHIKNLFESNLCLQDKKRYIEKISNPFDKNQKQVLYNNIEAYKNLVLLQLEAESDFETSYKKLKDFILHYGKQKEYFIDILRAYLAMSKKTPCNKQQKLCEEAITKWEEVQKEPTIEELLLILTLCARAKHSQLFQKYQNKVPVPYLLYDERFNTLELKTKNNQTFINLIETNKDQKYKKQDEKQGTQSEAMRGDNISEEEIKDIILQTNVELLTRSNNLKKGGADSKKLDDEDVINDWLTSLLRVRFANEGIYVSDQSRMGVSATGKNSGEVDICIFYPWGGIMCLIEALKLDCVNIGVIKSHHNKINGYSASGCKTIALVVYAQSNNFLDLAQGYKNHINENDYSGYQRKSNHEIIEVETNFANIKLFKETRLRNEAEITFLHFLLDFGVE